MKLKRQRGLQHLLIWGFTCLTLLTVKGQKNQQLSPSEIHQLVERYINYSRDSSLVLLNLASQKIRRIQDKDSANALMAENNLRRADYWTFYDLDSAEAYTGKSFDYYRQNIDDKRLAEIYILKAQMTRIKYGKITCAVYEALPYFDSALTYAEKYNNPAFLSFIYYERSISFELMERWDESFANAVLALKNAQISGDSLTIATSCFLMGRTYHHFGLFNSSESYIAKSIDYGRGMTQLYSIIHIYADVLLQNDKQDLAQKNYEKALKIALEKNNLSKASTLYTSIGQIQLNKGDYKGAENSYAELNSILESNKSAGYHTLLFIAQMHYHLGDNDQALEDLDLFKTKFGSGSVIPRNIDVFKDAADLHTSLNQPELATFYYKKWGVLKDSLYSHTSKQQLNALEVMYLKERRKNVEIVQKNDELSESRQQQATMGGLLIIVILLGGGLVYFIRMKGMKENQALKFALKEKQLGQLMEAQETERQRLARELHDGIGQSLAALKMQLQFDKNPQASDTTVQRVDDICNEVRSLSHQMMPIVLKENGLQSAVEQLIDHSFSTSSIEVDFVCFGLNRRLPDNIEVNVYRITQELISNIIRHSKASKAGIQLLKRGKTLLLIVEDNGKGFRKDDKAQGIGLSNINVRLEALGGTVQIQSAECEGTYIHVAIPTSSEINKRIA
ncbi:ATP-binding protein [Owenweeksia hongkongensis]|uniref:tetratricopeptide repeat-containing sensor histidine kinase n=1 Tax=Owenweeksia hongkongensis TaxID=253245 RepID=UPI003A8F3BB2